MPAEASFEIDARDLGIQFVTVTSEYIPAGQAVVISETGVIAPLRRLAIRSKCRFSTGVEFEPTTRKIYHPGGRFKDASGNYDVCIMEMKQDPSIEPPNCASFGEPEMEDSDFDAAQMTIGYRNPCFIFANRPQILPVGAELEQSGAPADGMTVEAWARDRLHSFQEYTIRCSEPDPIV